MMRLLLVSDSGSPFLEHCRSEIAAFLGPIRRVGYITAARLGDEQAQFEKASRALGEVSLTVEHMPLGPQLAARIRASEAVFSSGGNTYALLSRLHGVDALGELSRRIREGMPYIGTSAGTNIAGPNILATNDWNVVGATRFEAMGLVPWAINPHYKETDPVMAPGSETRDQRIGEYLRTSEIPVLAIEEGTAIRIEGPMATVVGRGRARLFRRGRAPEWFGTGQRIPTTGDAVHGA